MCKYFKFMEGSKIIGDCSKIEQDVLCCGDKTECECKELFEDSVFEDTPLEESTKSVTELLEEIRKDVADIKVLNNELKKLIEESEHHDIDSTIRDIHDASKIAKRFPDEVSNG